VGAGVEAGAEAEEQGEAAAEAPEGEEEEQAEAEELGLARAVAEGREGAAGLGRAEAAVGRPARASSATRCSDWAGLYGRERR
jgi:hypothetical protein